MQQDCGVTSRSANTPPASDLAEVLWRKVAFLEVERDAARRYATWAQKHAQLAIRLLWHCRRKHGEVVTVGEDERLFAEVDKCKCELCSPTPAAQGHSSVA